MKTGQLQLRVSPEQKAIIRSLASRAHMDMSQWVLSKIFPKPRQDFLALIRQLSTVQAQKDRTYILNDLNAFLAGLDKDDIFAAVADPHGVVLNEFMENYVSAMIEQTCVKAKVAPPKWLASGLSEPFFGSNLISLRLYLLTVSPPPFRKRNIFIDSAIGDLV
jgi:uncharacterized protein (DUF1778 family)